MTSVTRVSDLGHGAATAPATRSAQQTAPTIAIKERKMSLLEYELSRARIQDRERQLSLDLETAARVRAVRRHRRDTHRVQRLRRILLAR